MTNRTALINELESLLIECFNTIANLTTYQQIKENDARVTFFKHLVNVIDSTIVSLLVAHKYLGDENWWKKIQKVTETKKLISVNLNIVRMANDVQETDVVTDDDEDIVVDPDPILDLEFDEEDEDEINMDDIE
jgi:predicted metallo-beta-lactamase superfamily hydrolase